MKFQLKISLMICTVFLLLGCTNDLAKIPLDKSVLLTFNIKDQTMTLIDQEEKEVFAEWELPQPYSDGVLLDDNDTLILLGKSANTVDLYSLSKGKKIDSWDTGKGIVSGHLLPNDRVALADQYLHKLRIFSLEGKELGSVHTGKNPRTILHDKEDNELLYVISFDGRIISAINYEDMREKRSFSIHSNASGALISTDAQELWVGGHGEGNRVEENIHVYDLSTGDLLKKIPASNMPVDFVEHSGIIYTLSHGTNIVYKFDVHGELIESLPAGINPFALAISDGDLIVAGYDSNDVTYIDLETFSISKTIPVGEGPFKIIVRE